jgi:flagellar motility protein MotE (MotC chaperone)
MTSASMYRHAVHQRHDRHTGAPSCAAGTVSPSAGWRDRLWTVCVGVGVTIALSWATVQLVRASVEQGLEPRSVLAQDVSSGLVPTDLKPGNESPMPGTESVQGPALTVPEEMIAMFQQRKQDLERRENAVRVAEAQLAMLKAEVAQILSKVEAVEQRRLGQEKAGLGGQASPSKKAADLRMQQLAQLAKMYESMPVEEAAARIERMADRKALEILRLLKSKSAGSILAQVKADRAAKLSEEFLTTP